MDEYRYWTSVPLSLSLSLFAIGTMGRDVVLVVCVCVLPRPRVRDGTPAEVVCGYFGDWFYRVGNGTRAAPVRSPRPLSLTLSIFLSFSPFRPPTARVRERAYEFARY